MELHNASLNALTPLDLLLVKKQNYTNRNTTKASQDKKMLYNLTLLIFLK